MLDRILQDGMNVERALESLSREFLLDLSTGHGVAWVEFKLSLKDGKLTGAGTAIGPEYFALSHWVELAKAPDAAVAGSGAEPYDLLLRGGRVVDGTGTPWYDADVAIKGGRMAAIGRLKEADADRTIDVCGPGRRPRVHRHDGPDRRSVPQGLRARATTS